MPPTASRSATNCDAEKHDPSLRPAACFFTLSLANVGLALLGLGEEVTGLAKGLAFVFLILALHFMTTPRS